jgi:hypothetical protein
MSLITAYVEQEKVEEWGKEDDVGQPMAPATAEKKKVVRRPSRNKQPRP